MRDSMTTVMPQPGTKLPVTPRRHKNVNGRPFTAGRAIQYVLLFAVVMVSVVPLLWMIVNAFRPNSVITAYPPSFLPKEITFEHFRQLFEIYGFHTYIINSLVVSLTATVVALLFGVTAAYAMSRFDFRAIRAVGELSLLAYLIPPILVLVPVTQLLFGNGLGDNRAALAVLYVATLLPFALWILRSYFSQFSVDVEEAAMIDGCTRFGAFIRVVLPQAIPGIVSTAIFTFNAAWSEYLFASTLMTSNEKLPANPAIFLLMGHMGTTSWGLLMAAALTIVLPVLVLFIFAQRWLVSGLSDGAIKG